MAVQAIYFDGEYARDRAITVEIVGKDLQFSGADVPLSRWSISGLHPIDPPSPGQPFRITHDAKPGARLVLRDEAFINRLVQANSHLKGGYSWSHLRQVAAWTVGGLAVAAGLLYFTVAFLPQRVAQVLPDGWRNRIGQQVVDSLVDKKAPCSSAEGNAAKSAMVAALANGNPDLPSFSFEVYDIDILNAFAAPGGKIVFTRRILQEAKGPDEIAGVLAHEIGHVHFRHPEAQLVRMTGLQVVISVLTGTDGGNWSTSVAALAALLRYSREAEREADSFARKTLEQASIDPQGLKRFFEVLLKLEGKDTKPNNATASKSKETTLDKIGNVFSTHPGTEDRIQEIQPLPAGKTPVTVLTDAQWKALQNICGK